MKELIGPIDSRNLNLNSFLDDMLKGICIKIQPLESTIERFESSYKIIEDILKSAPTGSIIHKVDLKVFVHGSVLSDTVVKPIFSDEVDLDVVILFKLDHQNIDPRAIQDEIFKILIADERYKDKVKKKPRCVTIQYKTNFHIDLMPALPEFLEYEDNSILVPHKLSNNLFRWHSSNPIGLIEWLNNIEKKYKVFHLDERLVKNASIEITPFPKPKKYKSNLRYIIQLLKRARDNYFKDDNDSKKIARSIALLVLTGTHYRPQQNSLIAELLFVVSKIEETTADYMNVHVFNPLHSDREEKYREDFAEKWKQDRDLFLKFRQWIKSLKHDLEKLYDSRNENYNHYVEKLKEIFHATPVDNLLNEYGEKTNQLQNTGKIQVQTTTGSLIYEASANSGILVPKAKSFGDEGAKKYFRCEPTKIKLPLYAHIEKMRRDFPNFKMNYVKGERSTVQWIGEVKPESFGDKYKISITYKEGYHPIVKILSHDVEKHPKHIYPGGNLCLYHPYDGKGRWRMDEAISTKIIPLTLLWIVQWEIWKNTGTWNGDEHPHKSINNNIVSEL